MAESGRVVGISAIARGEEPGSPLSAVLDMQGLFFFLLPLAAPCKWVQLPLIIMRCGARLAREAPPPPAGEAPLFSRGSDGHGLPLTFTQPTAPICST